MSPHESVMTLESVLDNSYPDLFKEFAAFMKQTYCSENLAFWRAVEHYRESYDPYRDNGEQKEACEKIVERHIEPESDQEINIPCEMRQEILDRVDGGDYRPDVFDLAAAAVVELMRSNAFIPWMTKYCPERLSRLSPTTTRSSMPSSISFPDRWQLHKLIKSPRPSCSSFCSVDQKADRRHTQTYESTLERLKKSLGLSYISNIPSRRWSVWRKTK